MDVPAEFSIPEAVEVPDAEVSKHREYSDAVLRELKRLVVASLDTMLATLTSANLATALEINAQRFTRTQVFEQYRKWGLEPEKCATLVFARLYSPNEAGLRS